MFREITVSKQADDGPKRRWYQSDYFDLFVFYYRHSERADVKADREFVGMQLCYDIRRARYGDSRKRTGRNSRFGTSAVSARRPPAC